MRRAWPFIFKVILSFLLSSGVASCILDAQQGEWQTRTLADGMRITYCQDSTRQLLHVGLSLRGGASLDPTDVQGLAKLYEHLFFQYLPDGKPATLAADQGIFLSHKTLLESHFFGMSLPPPQMPAAFHLLQTGLGTIAWNDSTLNAAREALIPSLQAQDLTPESHLVADLREALWQGFASRKQMAGKYADILHLGSQRIWEEIAPYHHPQNFLLSATGPDGAEAFFSAAEAGLGAWETESAGAILPKVPMPTLTKSLYFQTVNELAVHPLIMIAWPILTGDNPAQTSLNAQHFCSLAQLKQGLMYRHLVDSGLVSTFEWSWEGGLNPGQLLLYVIPETNRFAECMRALQTELAHLGDANRFSPEEVATANRLLRLQVAQDHDHSIARLLAEGNAWMLSAYSDSSPSQVQLSDIRAFVQANLANKPHVAGLLLNSETAFVLNTDSVFQSGTGIVATVDVIDPPQEGLKTIAPNVLRDLRVYFKADPLKPDTVNLPTLEQVAAMLHDQPQRRVFLNSFSEGEGDGVRNYQLSVSRAKAIRSWLVDQAGIPPRQVVIRAYGEAFPEFPDENDLRNRRMTFEYAPADAQDNAF